MGKLTPLQMRQIADQYAKKHPKEARLTPEEIEGLDEILNRRPAAAREAAAAGQNRIKHIDDMRWLLYKVAIPMLDQWKENVDSVISLAPLPEDDTSKKYWWISLAGNLLWAATVYMSAGGTASIASSFIGATFGSGTVTFNKSIQDGRNSVRQSVAEMRGALEGRLESVSREWAKELVGLMPQLEYKLLPNPDKFLDVFVWDHLFDITYDEHRFKRLGDVALSNIRTALWEFNRQFEVWRRQICMKKLHASYKYGVEDCNSLSPFRADLGRALGQPGLKFAPSP